MMTALRSLRTKCARGSGRSTDYVIAPEFEPGLSRLGQDAAWFQAREAAQEWPVLAWNGTSIYDLQLDELKTVYGEPERISHEPFLQEEYYDVLEFPDGSQAGGICYVDTSMKKPNAAYLRLLEGTDACGVTAGRTPGGCQPISARRAPCYLSRRRAHGAAASWRRGALHGEIQPHRVHRRRTDHTS